MCKNIKLPHCPAIKICPFGDPWISCIFWILAVTEQGFADNVTLLSCNATFPAFIYSSSFFHLPVFFTGACLYPFLSLHQTSLLTFILVCTSSLLIHSLGECVFLFLGFNVVITITHLGKHSCFYMSSTSSFLKETCNAARLPMCTSLPTGKNNKTQEKLKTCRKFLTETHCIPHSGTVKHELFTWNTIIKFSKEHKTFIVSQECFSCVAWNMYVELHFRGGKRSHFGHMISYMVLKILGYISCYIVVDYFFAFLMGSPVYSNFKLDSLKVHANHWKLN